MTTVKVQFSTNRQHVGGADIFGSEQRSDKQYVTGSVDIAQAGGNWGIDYSTVKINPPIPYGIRGQTADGDSISAFAGRLSQANKLRLGEPAGGIVFIHGFNTNFTTAVIDAAFIANAYKVRDAYCVSWPALEAPVSVAHYKRDKTYAEASGQFATSALHELLKFLALEASKLPALQIVAHSMGNYVLGQALQHTAASDKSLNKPNMFKGAILIAADEGDDSLSKGRPLATILTLAEQVAVYYNGGDWALTASRIVNGWWPLGIGGPRDLADLSQEVTSIDCSRVALVNDKQQLGHAYFRTSPKVIDDIAQVLAGIAPDKIKGRIENYIDPVRGRAWYIPY